MRETEEAKAQRIREYAKRVVAAAPPMTPEQRARVVELLRPVAVHLVQRQGGDFDGPA